MAVSVVNDQDMLSCTLCFDLLKDPVTIPCGDSFCLDCINRCWNQDDQMEAYRCPQCKQTFTPKPVLCKNTVLVKLIEKTRKMILQADPPGDVYAGPEDVECDVCTLTKHKAVKSCLVCLASYCETHIQSHYESPAFKKHKLMEASMNLKEKICSPHHKLLEMFCGTDQKFICYLCAMDEHSGHNVVSAAAKRKEKQMQLLEQLLEFKQRIQQREKELQDLTQSSEFLRYSALAAVENSEKIFTELILSIEKKRSEVKEWIKSQEEADVSLLEELQKKLKQEIADLRRRATELEQLSQTEDHIHFLQSFQSLSVPPVAEDLGLPLTSSHFSIEKLTKAVSAVKEQVNIFDKSLLVKFSEAFAAMPSQPKTRGDFLKHFCQQTLDLNTANCWLGLSEGNRKVTVERCPQDYPDHPARFDMLQQVLCRERLADRCYWEVEWSVSKKCIIAVCYEDINRKGNDSDCSFGCNDQSWGLTCCLSSFFFKHDDKVTKLPAITFNSRIGVYVDHSSGILSFYSVSDTMTLIHKVQTTFTKPLYAGLQICGFGNFLQIMELV